MSLDDELRTMAEAEQTPPEPVDAVVSVEIVDAEPTCCQLAVADAAERVSALKDANPYYGDSNAQIGWRAALKAASAAVVRPLVDEFDELIYPDSDWGLIADEAEALAVRLLSAVHWHRSRAESTKDGGQRG